MLSLVTELLRMVPARGIAQVFIPLMRFQLQSFVLKSFFVGGGGCGTFFLSFSFISVYLRMSASNNFKGLLVNFTPIILMLSWFDIFIPSAVSLFSHFLTSMTHFSILNSIPISYCLYQDLQFFLIFCKYLYIIHIHKVINLSLWFCKFVAHLYIF